MTDDEAWALEEKFWTGDTAHYAAALDPQALLVFPPPAGILTADAALAGLKSAPRWSQVTMSRRHVARPAGGVVVLAYRAVAKREGTNAYVALCGSTYACHAETKTWRLVAHQQVPAGDD